MTEQPEDLEAIAAESQLAERDAEIGRLREALAIFSHALDTADNLIAVNVGTSTPDIWNDAFCACAESRAALFPPIAAKEDGPAKRGRK